MVSVSVSVIGGGGGGYTCMYVCCEGKGELNRFRLKLVCCMGRKEFVAIFDK